MQPPQADSQLIATGAAPPKDEKHNDRVHDTKSLVAGWEDEVGQATSSSTSTKVEDEKRDLENGTLEITGAVKSIDVINQAISSKEAENEKSDLENGPTENTPTEPPGTRYLDPKELAWISFAFTMATFMLALDVSIIGV